MRTPSLLSLGLAVALLAAPIAAQQAPAAPSTPDRPMAAPALVPGSGSGPNGATLRCRDGFYPAPGATDTACDARGGVLVRFPSRRAVPPAEAQPAAAPATPERRAAPRDTAAPSGALSYERRQAQARATEQPQRRPEGATLLCNDGSYVVRDTSAARCQAGGGVRLRFVAPRVP
jgi:hypothetical protein